MKNLNEMGFEMSEKEVLLATEELCSKLEDLLKNKPFEHYYYAYVAARKYLTSAIVLAKYSKEEIEEGVNNVLKPSLQKNEMIESKENISVDILKENYNEILNYIDLISKTLEKAKHNICISTLTFFESYIVDTGFIKRETLSMLDEFADSYYEVKK